MRVCFIKNISIFSFIHKVAFVVPSAAPIVETAVNISIEILCPSLNANVLAA